MAQYFDYNARMAVPDQLFTPLHGVKLTGGLFRKVFDDNVQFNLKRLDMDRMRYWFDIKQGRTPKAERYSGHFEDNLKGQTASQYLMGAGNALRWEEHQGLRKGVGEVIDFISEAAEDDGWLMPFDKNDFARKEYPHYTRIWLTYGLIAAARGGDKRAFPLLRRWQDWFNRCPDLPVIKYLMLAFQGVVASPSVFVTEIGCPQDMHICRDVYEETWRLAQFISHERDAVHIRRQPGREPHPHGSELEAFEGYLDLYRFFGAPYLLNAVKGCWDLYVQDWQHPGGGIVMCEASPEAHPGCNYFYKNHKYNELCCSSFWLHLNQRLHRLFPDDERYVFEVEQSLYNIAIANQNGDVDIRYFAFLDDSKAAPERPNHCCSGVGTRIFGSLPEYLYTMTKDTLSCDIYAPSQLQWESTQQLITVDQESGFPNDGKVALRFSMAQPQEFTLRLRIPRYATADVPIKLNGKKHCVGKPGTYVVIYRQWRQDDAISFDVPMGFAAIPYKGDNAVEGFARCAYTYGPLLMAIVGKRNHDKGIILPGKAADLIGRLKAGKKTLSFAISGSPGYKVQPYYELQTETFSCFPMFKTDSCAKKE